MNLLSVRAIISPILTNRQAICQLQEIIHISISPTLSCQSLAGLMYLRYFSDFLLTIHSFLVVHFSFIWNHCNKVCHICHFLHSTSSALLPISRPGLCLCGGKPDFVSLCVVNRHVLRGKVFAKLMGTKSRGKWKLNRWEKMILIPLWINELQSWGVY